MQFKLERINDKIEFFQSLNLKSLEKMIDQQIEINRTIMLSVHSVTHQVAFDPDTAKPLYTAVVHFRAE